MTNTDEKIFLLALSLIPGLGTARIHQLLRDLGSGSRLFQLDRKDLTQLGLAKDIRAWFESGWAVKTAEKVLKETARNGIGILAFSDPAYPHLLKTIHDPPVVLYFRGEMSYLQKPAIAVVGSRRCSVYGRQVTEKLAREIAGMGLVVTSGLARGIDACAHRGAIETGGLTVAVLGSGVDVVYPKENTHLYKRIVEAGCMVSEFPCGTYPGPQNFPIRNRIISGLCLGTLITEAAEYSGSLITARMTAEQNRELWAVPGNITNPGSYGPNYLIKQGAKPVMELQDILDELPPFLLQELRPLQGKSAGKDDSGEPTEGTIQLPENEKRTFNFLPVDSSLHFDELLRKSGMSHSELSGALFSLEMKGLVRQLPGRYFAARL